MPGKKSVPKARPADARTDPSVVGFLRDLDHPLKKELEAVRRLILGASTEIHEGIKWNSPSFRTTDYFATLNLRGAGNVARVWLILHTGAKAKGLTLQGGIADPAGLLKWLAKDRALVTFADAKEVKSKQKSRKGVVREWIKVLGEL